MKSMIVTFVLIAGLTRNILPSHTSCVYDHGSDPRQKIKTLQADYGRLNALARGKEELVILQKPLYRMVLYRSLYRENDLQVIKLNRERYNDLRMIQRKQLLARIESLPLRLNKLIASFIIGGASYHGKNTFPGYVVAPMGYYMLLKGIRSLPEKWSACAFAREKGKVFAIGAGSRSIHAIDLEHDTLIDRCDIPYSLGVIGDIEGDIPGLVLVRGSKGAGIWQGGDNMRIIPSHKAYDLCACLPPKTLQLFYDYEGQLVALHKTPSGTIHKQIIASAEEQETYQVVYGSRRALCMLIHEKWVRIYDPAAGGIQDISCIDTLFKDDHIVGGALAPGAHNICVWGKKRSYIISRSTGGSYMNNFIEGIRAISVDQEKAKTSLSVLVHAPVLRAPTVLVRGSEDIVIHLPVFGEGIKETRLRSGRLLMNTQDGSNRILDIPDLLCIARELNSAQVDLCDSLHHLWTLFHWYDSPYYSSRHALPSLLPKAVKLNVEQSAVWRTIPQRFRRQFIKNADRHMIISTVKKRAKRK